MINEENLNKLYEGIINDNELTTKKLNCYGFNSKDLSDLIEDGVLERVKRGYYSLKLVDELFLYGKRLIREKQYDRATQCFLKCHEIDSSHRGTCFQLFLRSINKKDYDATFKYLEILLDTENPHYMKDCNFYLYLLSLITEVPDKHREYAKYLRFEDVSIDSCDKRYQDIELQNKIRLTAIKRKLPFALKQLKDLIAQHGSMTVQDIITKTLLHQALEVDAINKNIIIELAKNKAYEEIVKYFEEKEKRISLNISEINIVKLAKEALEIQKTKQIPIKTIFRTEKLYEAIDGKNFELALSIKEIYNKENNVDNSENTISILLSDICNMIKQISTSKQTSKDVELKKDFKKQLSQVQSDTSNSILFSDITRLLLQNDIENASKKLKNYLISINKKEYEFLIMDLIKLSLIEKDMSFSKPMLALTYMSRENFKFDISNYIQEFYVALSQNRFEEARIYLHIISSSNGLVDENVLTEGLLQVLNTAENAFAKVKDVESIDSKIEDNINLKEELKIETNDLSQTLDTNETIKSVNVNIIDKKVSTKKTSNKSVSTKEEFEMDKKFIQNKHDFLEQNKGILILKPMDEERRKRINKIVATYSDMVSFSIGEGKNIQIVLRYKPYIEENINVKNLIEEANDAYEKGDYTACINGYLQLLQIGNPYAIIYSRLGFSYMKKRKIDKAIDYLTVATHLNKKENKNRDFTELIDRLKNPLKPDEIKPYFKMTLDDFENDVEENYGIGNLDEITSYILENELDVETACSKLNIPTDQIDIIRLIYAREYYSQGDYEKGDQFLKTVERSKNKTKFTAKLYEEIRRNKRFYINRSNEESKKLSLKLKPKK